MLIRSKRRHPQLKVFPRRMALPITMVTLPQSQRHFQCLSRSIVPANATTVSRPYRWPFKFIARGMVRIYHGFSYGRTLPVPEIRYEMPRYSKVPWLGDWDLRPAGLPEDTQRQDTRIAHVMRIQRPFGKGTEGYMTVSADMATGKVAMRIVVGDVVECPVINWEPKGIYDNDEEDDRA